MAEFVTVKKAGKTKQVLVGPRLEAAEAEGWKPVGTKRIETETGERTVESGEALKRARSGEGTIIGEQEIQRRAGGEYLKEQYGSEGVQAFGEAGLGALSFGLIDPGDISEWSEGDAGATAARAEANPLESTAGSVTGSVLGALAPGGLGRVLPSAIGARIATKAGQSVAARTGSRVAGMVAEGATDAAIFGTGQQLANAVIADKPINVENLIADIPSQVMFGAGAGALIGGLGKLSKRIKAKEVAKQASADDVAKAKKAVSDATLAQAEATFAKGEARAATKAQNKLDGVFAKSSSPELPAELSEITERLAQQADSAELSIRTLTKADLDDGIRAQLAEALGRNADEVRLGDMQRAVTGNAAELRTATKTLSDLGNPLDLDAANFGKYVNALDNAQVARSNLDGILHQVGSGRTSVQPIQLTKLDDVASGSQFFDEAGDVTDFGELAGKMGVDPEGLSQQGELLAKAWVAKQARSEVAKLSSTDIADATLRKAKLTKAQEAAKLREAKGFGTTTGRTTGGGLGSLASRAPGRLGNMFRAVTAGPEKIKSGIAGFIKLAGKPRRGTVPAASTILGQLKFDDDLGERPKNQGRKAEMKRVIAELDSIATDPEKARQKIHDTLGESIALKPSMTSALLEKAFQRMMFLHGLVPRSPNNTPFSRDNWSPSDTVIDKFTRIAAAAENPYSILDDLQEGRLTQEAVDTVKQLYPEIYHSICMEVINNVELIKQDVKYTGRLQLGMLFQAPTDEVLKPGYGKLMQENYAIRAQEQEQTGSNNQYSTPGNNQKAVAATATTSQRLESK